MIWKIFGNYKEMILPHLLPRKPHQLNRVATNIKQPPNYLMVTTWYRKRPRTKMVVSVGWRQITTNDKNWWNSPFPSNKNWLAFGYLRYVQFRGMEKLHFWFVSRCIGISVFHLSFLFRVNKKEAIDIYCFDIIPVWKKPWKNWTSSSPRIFHMLLDNGFSSSKKTQPSNKEVDGNNGSNLAQKRISNQTNKQNPQTHWESSISSMV